jgi:hypothetical protein
MFVTSGSVRHAYRFSGGFHPLLECLKRFIVLLPDAAMRIADDFRTRAGLSLS